MSDPLFTHLRKLSMALVYMQEKIFFDTPMLNYILPFSIEKWNDLNYSVESVPQQLIRKTHR